MKKLIITLAVMVGMLSPSLLTVGNSSAVQLFNTCGQGSASGTPGVCVDAKTGQTSKVNPIVMIIADIIRILSVIIGVAAIVGIIFSGIRMAIANGDPNTIATARNALMYSLIGLAVAALAGTIVTIIIGSLS